MTAAGRAGDPPGRQLVEIERTLRLAVQTAADSAVRRALERAGNRLKGRAGVLRDTLRTTPPLYAPAVAGPALIADAGLTTDDLLDGAWDDVVARYRRLSVHAFDDAQDVVGVLVGEWRTGYPAAMRATFGAHLDESAEMFRRGLHELTASKFLDPKGLDEAGELVPTGFVRHVLARAGGQTDIVSTGYAYVAVTGAGGPLPGLTTGPVISDAVRDHGGTVEAFRWVYGPAMRSQPFRPHQRLSGVTFRNFDDPKLANGRGWPPFAFYIPGDHAGCRCDVEPILLAPAQAAALGYNLPDLSPTEQRRAEREARLAAAGERFGVSADEVRASMPQVREMRQLISDDAALTQARAFAVLDRGSFSALQLPRPPKNPADRGGEWDWLRSLTQEERSRLSRGWYTDTPGAAFDVIAEYFAADNNLAGRSIDDVMEKVWLPLNRQLEAAGALRRGRIPIGKHYSNRIDANDLAPNVHASGVDIYRVVGVPDEDAAAYLASLERERLADDAYNLLGSAAHAAEPGARPWEMSYLSWHEEMREIEYVLREFPDQADDALRRRYAELVPELLDEPGLDPESLYAVIVQTARLAGQDVPGHARIPWAE